MASIWFYYKSYQKAGEANKQPCFEVSKSLWWEAPHTRQMWLPRLWSTKGMFWCCLGMNISFAAALDLSCHLQLCVGAVAALSALLLVWFAAWSMHGAGSLTASKLLNWGGFFSWLKVRKTILFAGKGLFCAMAVDILCDLSTWGTVAVAGCHHPSYLLLEISGRHKVASLE